MIFHCCDPKRLDRVAQYNQGAPAAPLNGIDYLEVLDQDAYDPLTQAAFSPRQRTLMVHLLLPPPVDGSGNPTTVGADNVRIQGGVRLTQVNVVWVDLASNPSSANLTADEKAYFNFLPDASRILLVRTDTEGDFADYTLQLLADAADPASLPPAGFDPRLSSIRFNFKVECPNPFDCAPEPPACPAPAVDDPEINYLAKDYPTFRSLLLDRLGQLVPGWAATSPADLGVALSELVAYVGDYLSYQQDSVATEAFLPTARRRVSLRRHALLADYRVFEGCNSRAWVQVKVNDDGVPLRKGGARFYTRIPGLPGVFPDASHEAQLAAQSGAQAFEPMADYTLYKAQSDPIPFYAWGDGRCCLPIGATSATLRVGDPVEASGVASLPVNPLHLNPGDVLVFKETRGPRTGSPSDADPARRWAVRLTQVTATADGLPAQARIDPLPDDQGRFAPIVEIQWDPADALPFPLCVSASLTAADGTVTDYPDVSVALGNIVLVDQGATLEGEDLGSVPGPTLFFAPAAGTDWCDTPQPVPVPSRYRPVLSRGPLTHAAAPPTITDASGTLLAGGLSASGIMAWTPDQAVPAVALTETMSDGNTRDWSVQPDLLESSPLSRDFTVETESDGTAFLRFGDDTNGERPTPDSRFSAAYRVGNGATGNVGQETIVHVQGADARVTGALNPLPARGGRDPETDEQIRRRAPQAFRVQQRAVTPADYEAKADLFPGVQKTAARFRWTGSWHTVFLTVDPLGGGRPSRALLEGMESYVEPFRMAGYDLEAGPPLYVPLEIELFVCVNPGFFRSDVEEDLLQVLGNKALPDGRRGFFNPDNLTFGQTVFLSPILSAARSVPGVDSVQATRFQKQGVPSGEFLLKGGMPLGGLEIARLDNDINFPENGVLRLVMCGGK